MNEEWRSIPGFPPYEASDLGRIRRADTGRVRTLTTGARGYAQVNLSNGRETATQKVHVLVAATFHGPRPNGLVIRHMDGVALNNRADNLAYGTQGDNRLDAVVHGTHNEARKTHCPNGHPYTDENTRTMRQRHGGPGRICRTCHRDRARAYYHARKEGSRND